MFSFCMSTESDHMNTNLGHKLHHMEGFGALKLQDFRIVFLDDDDTSILEGYITIL